MEIVSWLLHVTIMIIFMMNDYMLFPTSLCGVLVFDSVSRAPSPSPPPAARRLHIPKRNIQ